MDWTTTGYPPKHYEELGSAKRYAFKALAVTGSFMLIALAVVLYYGIHPGVAAFAIAIFVLCGVIGGLGWVYDSTRYVRVMLYFGRALGDIDTFLAGYTLARYLGQLDALATAHGAEPISAFGFADDLRGETLVWHDANEGLQCVRTLRQAIEGQPITRARITQIMNLNLLAPELQEGLLFRQPVEGGRDAVTLKGLQEVCLEANWGRQALTH